MFFKVFALDFERGLTPVPIESGLAYGNDAGVAGKLLDEGPIIGLCCTRFVGMNSNGCVDPGTIPSNPEHGEAVLCRRTDRHNLRDTSDLGRPKDLGEAIPKLQVVEVRVTIHQV